MQFLIICQADPLFHITNIKQTYDQKVTTGDGRYGGLVQLES